MMVLVAASFTFGAACAVSRTVPRTELQPCFSAEILLRALLQGVGIAIVLPVLPLCLPGVLALKQLSLSIQENVWE